MKKNKKRLFNTLPQILTLIGIILIKTGVKQGFNE